MLIAVGSANEVKVQAIKEAILDYPNLAQAKVISLAVSSGISDQPLSLNETIQGAKNRAKNAFLDGCHYSFGLESGLAEAPGTQTGYLNICVCSIYNGADYHIGLSTGFEVPYPILELIKHQNMDLSQACLHSGITANSKIGTAEGLIGILTKGRVNRKEYCKEAVITALVQLENSKWYIPTSQDF